MSYKKYLAFIFLLYWSNAFSQIKIGDNPSNINSSAILELQSTNKGLLMPRVALSSTLIASPLSNHVAGMSVYNTAVAGSGTTAVSPGFYYNDGTQWVRSTILSDGSETKVTAGTNVTVTGSGTTASPYVVNATGAVDATTTSKGIVQLAGDLSGTATAPSVTRIQGQAISATAPTSGQVLTWNGTAWTPTTSSSTNVYNADGTLTGNRTLSQGTNSLAFTSTATTGTSHFTVDGTTLNVDAVNNRIGVGTNSPSTLFSLVNNGGGSGAADDIELVSYGSASTVAGPTYFLRNSRGTATSPANLSNGDYIGNIVFTPRLAGGFAQGTIIQSNYRGNGTTNLTDLVFHTSNTLRMTINENGVVSLNNLSGTGTRMVVADANGILSTQSVPSLTEVDGVIGNEVTDATLSGGLSRSGTGTAVSPYTLGVATGGITNTMLATDAVTSAKILDGTIATADVANSAITGAKIENNVILPGTSSMTLPSGTTAQRPVTATAGMSRYNTTDNIMEYYNGTTWIRPTAGTTYTGSTSTVLNGTSFERAALTGDVTAGQNSNALTISNDAITSAKILDGTIATADLANGSITAAKLNQMSATNGQSLVWNGTTWAPSTVTFTETDGVIGNEVSIATTNGGLVRSGAGTDLDPYSLGMPTLGATNGQIMKFNGASWVLAADNSSTYNAINGLTLIGSDFKLGGTLTEATTIDQGSNSFSLTASTTNAFSVDGSTFSIDAANNRIGMGTTAPNSSLTTTGSFSCPIRNVSSSVTINVDDNIVLCDATSSGITLTLPNPTSCLGRVYVIKKTDTTNNTVTFSSSIKTSSSDNFNSVNYQMSLKIQSDGTNWWLVD